MSIVLTIAGKGGEHTVAHDLNFQSERYESNHKQVSSVGPCRSLEWCERKKPTPYP